MTRSRWFALVLMAGMANGCGGPSVTIGGGSLAAERTALPEPASTSGQEPPKPEMDSTSVRATPPASRSVAVEFTNVQEVDGCFFFSGPGRLGRTHSLGSRALLRETSNGTELIFGEQPIFLRPRGTTVFHRESSHTYGDKWSASEEIALQARGEEWLGTYRYEECEQGELCPGSCTIRASVRIF